MLMRLCWGMEPHVLLLINMPAQVQMRLITEEKNVQEMGNILDPFTDTPANS